MEFNKDIGQLVLKDTSDIERLAIAVGFSDLDPESSRDILSEIQKVEPYGGITSTVVVEEFFPQYLSPESSALVIPYIEC